jgi:hypothetical protein
MREDGLGGAIARVVVRVRRGELAEREIPM